MARRAPLDFALTFRDIPVTFLSGKKGMARAEGNNAAWTCECGDPIPLLGRCYYQFGDTCYSVCPSSTCNRKYRVIGRDKKAIKVVEI